MPLQLGRGLSARQELVGGVKDLGTKVLVIKLGVPQCTAEMQTQKVDTAEKCDLYLLTSGFGSERPFLTWPAQLICSGTRIAGQAR